MRTVSHKSNVTWSGAKERHRPQPQDQRDRLWIFLGVSSDCLSRITSHGARVILATAPSGKAMSSLVGGLGANGTLVIVGVSIDPIEASPNQLLFGKKGIK